MNTILNPTDFLKQLEKLIDECREFDTPEKEKEFEREIALIKNENIDLYVKCAKCAKLMNQYCPEKYCEIKQRWHQLYKLAEFYVRRQELKSHPQYQSLKANLWWFEEQNLANQPELLNDPYYVALSGEEVYQRNKNEWEEKYAGQYIAIYQGEIINAGSNIEELREKIKKRQQKKELHRVYLVKVGEDILHLKESKHLCFQQGQKPFFTK